MKIIFFGSDDFAVVNLDAILKAGHEVAACVTSVDKPKGRGLAVTSSPVKAFAVDHKIALLQPEDLRDAKFVQQLKDYSAEIFVVIAYGKLLPPEVLLIPKICAINAHGSLLPKYRGAAPINWAIIHGEVETGISIIKLNPQMDAGDIIAQEKIPIAPTDTAVTLRAKLASLSAECLCGTIPSLLKKDFACFAQKKAEVTFAPKLKKELGLIDWRKSAKEIQNLVRGLLPWPTAYTFLNGKMFKILEVEAVLLNSPAPPGQVADIVAHGFIVATGDEGLLIKRVHPESGKPMPAVDFARGHKVKPGMRLGNSQINGED